MEISPVDSSIILNEFAKAGILFLFMLIVVAAEAWLIRYLIKRNEVMFDKMLDVTERNTQVITDLRRDYANRS